MADHQMMNDVFFYIIISSIVFFSQRLRNWQQNSTERD